MFSKNDGYTAVNYMMCNLSFQVDNHTKHFQDLKNYVGKYILIAELDF